MGIEAKCSFVRTSLHGKEADMVSIVGELDETVSDPSYIEDKGTRETYQDGSSFW
jgi:hypothetical protein